MEHASPSLETKTSTTGALTRRLLMGVLIAVAAFAITHRLGLAVFDDDAMALIGGAVAALGTAVAMGRIVSPLVAAQADLQVRYEAALADALRDQLTGLGNHRAFHEELNRQVEAARRYGMPLALLLIDLDEFKATMGPGMLAAIASCADSANLLGGSLRRPDRAFRVCGDEFAMLLPHTEPRGCARRCPSSASSGAPARPACRGAGSEIEAGQGYHLGRPGPIEQAVPLGEPAGVGMAGWRQSIGLPSVS